MPQVVGATAEGRLVLGGGEGVLPGLGPDLVVAGVLQDAAPGGLEDAPVGGGAVPLDVGTEQRDESARYPSVRGTSRRVTSAAWLPAASTRGRR